MSATAVVACEFAAAIAFGLVLDLVRIPVFARRASRNVVEELRDAPSRTPN
jgi:hypothetical protein